MKQQYTGPYTFDLATRTITLAGIEVPQERLALVVNSTVGFIYHNLEHEPTAKVSIVPSTVGGVLSAVGYDAIGSLDGDYTLFQAGLDKGGVINISGGVITVVNPGNGYFAGFANSVGGTRFIIDIDPSSDTVIVFPPYKDCETHRNTDALSIFYDDGVDLGQLIKDESDETQALLQAEFDETQTLVSDFKAEVKAEFDHTQSVLENRLSSIDSVLSDFKSDSFSQSNIVQEALDDTLRPALIDFKAQAKAEIDETQVLLNQKLVGLINGFLGIDHLVKYSAENGVEIDLTPGGYGPSQIVFSQGGATLKTLNLIYDARGNLVLITENPLLWTFASGLSGTITGFRAVFTGAVNLLLGNTSTVLTSNATTNHNASSGTPTLSLSSSSITSIVCGTSSPKLGGTIDVSGFPNLTSITCAGNGITRFQGYGSLTKLVDIDMRDNNFVQSSFETFANKPDLQTVNFTAPTNNQHIGMTGPFPIFLENPKLTELSINNTALTGSNLNFSHLTNLTILNIVGNALSGAFPILPTGANSKLVSIHVGQNKSGIRFTGSPPLFSDHPNLTQLFYFNNSATGPIQTIPSRATNFQCYSNLHTGDIPSLAGTSLGIFLCQSNQLTGFAGGAVPASLGNFQAQNNQLPAAAVNAILAAFVAAGRSAGTRVLNLGGTGNAAPTGQGIIDKATLEGRGWTVTTN